MKVRLSLAVIFTFFMLVLYGCWMFAVQPEVAGDIGLGQLERSDENAVAMRSFRSLQNYVFPVGLSVYVLGLLAIFSKYIKLGISFVKGKVMPANQGV